MGEEVDDCLNKYLFSFSFFVDNLMFLVWCELLIVFLKLNEIGVVIYLKN